MDRLRPFLPLISLILIMMGLWLVARTMVFLVSTPMSTQKETLTLGEKIRQGLIAPPSFATSTQDSLAEHPTFQALISFTDDGFEPREITIQRGETVRFVNNSSHSLWIAATSSLGSIYADKQQVRCGSSSLDSCFPPVSSQDFWQFTFERPGDWSYMNNIDKQNSGIVHVK